MGGRRRRSEGVAEGRGRLDGEPSLLCPVLSPLAATVRPAFPSRARGLPACLPARTRHEDRAVQPPPAHSVSISRATRFSVLESGRRSDSQQLASEVGPCCSVCGLRGWMGGLRGIKTPQLYTPNSAARTQEKRKDIRRVMDAKNCSRRSPRHH
ncbi:hypothetical protein Q5P01_011741 [Channa striata]|uniref:Uncharacterized protein n=1 Tax=Channa striata TaxID=64152 RepID=A0AA88SR24_CHASR|nr:hypothetical protein Q5P01_011741 [Channa striata]